MKKYRIYVLGMIFLLGLTACSSVQDSQKQETQIADAALMNTDTTQEPQNKHYNQ